MKQLIFSVSIVLTAMLFCGCQALLPARNITEIIENSSFPVHVGDAFTSPFFVIVDGKK